LESLLQDIRYGFRVLLKSPVFTIAAILCLGLGIGANAAIFSFVYGIAIRPLPFDDSHRLLYLNENSPARGYSRLSISYADFADWREQQATFENISIYSGWSLTLTGDGEPERISGTRVSHELLETLRVRPLHGRGFIPEEEMEGGARVVIIGHALWKNRYGSDSTLVGRTLILSGEPHTVVGVAPDGFTFPEFSQFWVPIRQSRTESRGNHSFRGVGRLNRGVSQEEARTELNTIAARLAEEYPETNSDVGAVTAPLKEEFVGDYRAAALIFYGVVCFVLLLACANVANLMLARAAARRREVAVRTSVGATRGRVVRQLLVESIVLSLFGGALGIGLGRVGRDLILAGIPVDIPYYIGYEMNMPVVLSMVGITVLCGILFGLAPAIESSNPHLVRTLQAGSGRTSDGVRKSLFRSALVAFEVGLALVVLVGAGLMMKSFLTLRTAEPGFDQENILTMRVSLPASDYSSGRAQWRFFEDAIQRIESIPGVVGATAAWNLPMSGYNWGISYYVEDTEPPPPGQYPVASHHIIKPGYFEILGIPLLQGRDFDERDVQEGSVPVAIVNETFVERYWPDENPLGKRFIYGTTPSEDNPWMEVIGVAGDARYAGLNVDIREGFYRTDGQYSNTSMALAVKTARDPLEMADVVRQAVWAIDPNLPASQVMTMERLAQERHWEPTLYSWMFGIFSLIALVLAAVGVYGVVSYSVAQRTREFGIRMALGAGSGRVVGLVVRQGMLLTAIGLVGGILVALALMRFLQSIMFGINPTDPGVYTITALAMAAVAILAAYLPARRATHVDPVIALRNE
jgi:putative ABC transport system permease protein